MSRFLTPLLMFGLAIYVAWYDSTHADRQLLVPGIDLLAPGSAGDPHALGTRSVQVLFALAVLTALWAGFGWVRERSRRRDE